jgi:hypothetical protein
VIQGRTFFNFCYHVSDPNIDNVTIKEHGKWGKKNYKLDLKQLVHGNGYNPSNFFNKN